MAYANRASIVLPVKKEAWDREFATGVWDYLDGSPAERARHAVIAMLCRSFGDELAVLDVGCGEATLFDFLTARQQDAYRGIDLSMEAVSIARRKRRNGVLQADAAKFDPGVQRYDVIVFNEVLYYLDAESAVTAYAGFLKPGGHIIVSTYRTPDEDLSTPVLNRVRDIFSTCIEIEVSAVTKGIPVTWRIEAFDPAAPGRGQGLA